MEIIFRDRRGYIFTTDGISIYKNHKDDTLYTTNRLKDIPYLENTKVLYHYRNDTLVYPVYYEVKEEIVIKFENYYRVSRLRDDYIRDYTLVNLKMIENEGDI